MSLHPMRPRFSIEAVVGIESKATKALNSNPRHRNLLDKAASQEISSACGTLVSELNDRGHYLISVL
ncbi:hypothetical protein E2C01_067561 [Portunus trituberculatus]|uniref:Uncharacterized protein n=1 Tax=Portunus trituberculatus TaxID=210409 RepID=A0A5B7HTZ0_PORTR|nr:hypothetical protein [Portunus trituberculatus]